MIDSNNGSDRLDRIEDDLETVKDILLAVARRAEATDKRLDELVSRQDRTQQQLDQLLVKHERLTEYMENSQASINASIERQDKILDYLMRRDRDGNGD